MTISLVKVRALRYDTSPIGTGKNWVTKTDPVEGLGAFVHAVVHALMRNGHPEGEAIQIALGVMKRWAAGIGPQGKNGKPTHVTAKTQAKAAAAVAHWEALKAKAHATPDKRQAITEAGSSAAALLPVGPTMAQAKAVYNKMGGHAFRGTNLLKCGKCGKPISDKAHNPRGAAQPVPPVPRQAKLISDLARSNSRGAIHELGVRWKFDPKQPRIKGKWAGPSAIEAHTPAAIQEKAQEAFIKVWGKSPELHAKVKEHLEAHPKATAASIKAKLIAEGGQVNYTHILAAVKKVKADQAPKPPPEPPPPPKPIGFNGSGHVGFGGTEALGKQAKDAGEAAKWFKPGDKVYAFTYTGQKLVPGVVQKITTEPLAGSELPVGFIHVQPLTGGPEAIKPYNELAVAHADVIDSLDAKALKLHAQHSSFKRVQAAYEQAAKQAHLTHEFKERTDAQLKALDKQELAFHLGQAIKALGSTNPYTKKVSDLVNPPPPFLTKTDQHLGLMTTKELAAEVVKATQALGANHPYVHKLHQYISGEVWHQEEQPEAPAVPEPPKYAPGSLEEAVAKHLKNEPNATSARIKELLTKEGHPDTNYSHILAAVKKIKSGQHVSGTSGPAPGGALVPEEAKASTWDEAPGTPVHVAVQGAKQLEGTFPKKGGYYGGITEGQKRTQKRKIATDIAKRLTAKVGGTYDKQLLRLCAANIKNPEGHYFGISTDGRLEHSGYQMKGYHLYGTPEASMIIRRAGVGNLVSGWAATSNDSRPSSLIMQDAAAGELGLTKTAGWAKLDAQTKAQMAVLMTDGTYDLCRQVARCMYEATQQNLKANGITHVKLYRGVKAEGMTEAAGLADLKRAKSEPLGSPGRVATVTLRPLSSWAFSKGTAHSFGYGGAVFSATVPASRIFSTAVTGFGCLNEHEVVVLGGEDKVLVT